MTNKLKMHTPNRADDNFAKLSALFPNAVTETIDENGQVVRAIDKDVLMQEISHTVVEGKEERYQFTWPDKKKSVLTANAPINKTLRPCREESVGKDGTKGGFDSENLYIEGDNLEVLKLLQETYLGKVKMIYIDPPYNTGKDFIYKDKRYIDMDKYIESSGQYDEDGNQMVLNTESNGRFHTDWLNDIYPKLKLARDLLTDDGVIFISIDDNEQANMQKICDEIFGERNFVGFITREAIKGGSISKNVRNVSDYIFIYAKNLENIFFSGIEIKGADLNLKDEKGNFSKGRELNKWGAGSRREDSPSMFFAVSGPNGEEIYPIRNDGSEGRWRLGREKMHKLISEGDVIYEKRENGTYIIYEKIRDDSPKEKQYTTIFKDEFINAKGTDELKKIFKTERAVFDFSKPTSLVKAFLIMSTNKEDIILDFFSGSATTAHAVMQLNAEDGGNRKFIMVQLPEVTDEKSEAYKAGYKNICEIGKERIRRAGQKIKTELDENSSQLILGEEPKKALDIGFRVLKCDSSNMKDVYYYPEETEVNMFDDMVSNIKEDRTAEDLLMQVMLDLGVLLSSKIECYEINGKNIFSVADDYLIACFDDNVTDEIVEQIAKKKPYYFVMRDSSLADSSVAVNFEQLFKAYSADTIRMVL